MAGKKLGAAVSKWQYKCRETDTVHQMWVDIRFTGPLIININLVPAIRPGKS